jgi:MFS family permease
MDSTVAGDSARPGDARRILATRALRGFADGLVSVLLATWLTRLGWSPGRIGGLVAATLLGSAALTIVLGLVGHRFPHRAVLLASPA